jgi:hypothetical protein
MDSATLMERLMTVEKTVSPYCFRIASNISACNVVLLSYCVTSMPSRFSPLLIFLCITATVSRMETRPYKEATSGCTGIIRSVAATSALTVISPTAGGQSRSTKSYPPSVLAASSLRKFSLPYSFCRRYSASVFIYRMRKNGKRPPSSSWSSSPSSLSTVRRRWLRFPHVTLRSPFRNSPYRTRRCSS